MVWSSRTVYKSPTKSVHLGRTLPSLLDDACDRVPHEMVLHQWRSRSWQSFTYPQLRHNAEALALGLQTLGLKNGDRVALLLHSDVDFLTVDMGSLLAGLVNVPIDLTQTLENILFVLRHSEARILWVANLDLLAQVAPYLDQAPRLEQVIVVDVPSNWQQLRSQSPPEAPTSPLQPTPFACLSLPTFQLHAAETAWPHCLSGLQVWSLEEIQRRGQPHHSDTQVLALRQAIAPHHLATLIYIPDGLGELEGVMLTHENLSANALAAFGSMPELQEGTAEIALSFLPLNHVFARVMLYGHLAYGHQIYFSSAARLTRHLKEVAPTLLATVPLMLEKVHSKLLEAAQKQPRWSLKRYIQQWGIHLAQHYRLGQPPTRLYRVLLWLADPLIFAHWRALFGGRLKYLLSGGAALQPEVANFFNAAGLTVLQGYGLTQTSSVVCFNRETLNRAGTVGQPLPGVEVSLAPDDEILVRGPYLTPGYYRNPAATRALIDRDGWLHTGDKGAFTAEGCLKIIGLKKDLFKLSTGKYIAPLPIEATLKRSPLVAQAVVVGADRKYCGLLIFPQWVALRRAAQDQGVRLATVDLLQHPWVLEQYQTLVDEANCHLPYWSLVKQFRLLATTLTVENGLLTPVGDLHRSAILSRFTGEIEALYGDSKAGEQLQVPRQPGTAVAGTACPVFAQSIRPSLTT